MIFLICIFCLKNINSTKSEKSLSHHQTMNSAYRMPPTFTRVPSRRQPRRVFNNEQQQIMLSEEKRLDIVRRSMHEVKSISIPQPVDTYESPYRSTCSIPAALNSNHRSSSYKAPDSPRSTRSVPWMRSHQRGLFGINSSPKSVRSATSRASTHHNNNSNNVRDRDRDGSQRRRSSSVESHSSNDSRSGKKLVLNFACKTEYI